MRSQIQIRKDIADRLKQAREQAGFSSLESFCETANLSGEEYRNHENGKTTLRASKAMQYCKLLNITLLWLMIGDEMPKLKDRI